MESSREFNFNAAFLELSRRENCLRGLTTLTLLRSYSQPLTLHICDKLPYAVSTLCTEIVIIHHSSPSLVIIRSWNQFLRYSTLQVYYCTIVNVHALPALGPDQTHIN
ncbi:hypothetical protein HOLleu_21532 [Holothuria leucospilota]|uniref:Uncharacterized protein n=1 Tax=Holothuria leucospilota TaxID=206669 RepID=A0A9Q1H642_HOLLE|nr:hypothetical protein HOLleu_21532 [Holothuria leucospilota]